MLEQEIVVVRVASRHCYVRCGDHISAKTKNKKAPKLEELLFRRDSWGALWALLVLTITSDELRVHSWRVPDQCTELDRSSGASSGVDKLGFRRVRSP